MHYASKRRTITEIAGGILVGGNQEADLNQFMLEDRVIDVACKLVHKPGAGHKVKQKWYGECLDLGLCKILSRVRSYCHYSH